MRSNYSPKPLYLAFVINESNESFIKRFGKDLHEVIEKTAMPIIEDD
jgi:hypothetical protein